MYMDHYKHQEHSMLSARECADKLQKHAQKTLTPQIQALEDELQDVSRLLAAKIRSIGYKLEALRHTELPATETILDDYLRDDIRKRDLEGEALALFIHGFQTKETQEEILSSLLDSAVNCFPRVALFVVRGDMFRGWSSRGFSDSTARTISYDEFSQADCSWLSDAMNNGDHAESADMPGIGSLRLMREESPGAWRLFPLHVLNRPVAILLAGEDEGFISRPKALAILMNCVALRLENVALKIIKTLGEFAPSGINTVYDTEPLSDAESDFQPQTEISSFVLNLNLTAPIEIPAPMKFDCKLHLEESDAFRPNPLAGLKLTKDLPESVADIQDDAIPKNRNESENNQIDAVVEDSDGNPDLQNKETNSPQNSEAPSPRPVPRAWEITRILKI